VSYLSRLNEILANSRLTESFQQRFVKMVSCDYGYLIFESKKSVSIMNENIESIYSGGLGRTVSMKWLSRRIINLCGEKHSTGGRFAREDVDLLEREIAGMPVTQVRVIRGVSGAIFSGESQPIKLGRFTLYDKSQHSELIIGDRNYDLNETFAGESMHKVLAECTVAAAEPRKIKELAALEFQWLESILAFMIGNRDYEFGIVNIPAARQSLIYTVSGDSFGVSVEYNGKVNDVPLTNELFVNPCAPFCRLMQLTEENANSLERKLMRSVEWVAQSLREPSTASAFVKAAIALEALFKTDEKSPFTPSLVAQLAEGCAQVLGTSVEECLKISKEIRELYGIRSKIVHSGSISASLIDLNRLISYSRSVIMALLSDPKYLGLESPRELNMMLLKMKYTCSPSLPH